MSKPFSDKPIQTNKIAMVVEYRGTNYHGWQTQLKPFVPTVQHAVEQAIAKVAAHPVKVFCAGRTDARVHGTSQVIHFETTALRSQKAWVCGVNAQLAGDIRVRWADAVADDFHARFSALARSYRYIIANTAVKPAVFDGQLSWYDQPLDGIAMHKAAQALLGEHDFSAFQAAACQSNTSFRHIDAISVRRYDEFLVMEVKANAFLLHMVRNIVGVLLEIGSHKKPVDWAAKVLASKDRSQASVTAKPEGLYFVRAHYPKDCGLPELAKGPLLLGPMLDQVDGV